MSNLKKTDGVPAGMHPGKTNLVDVLRKVVPFLFRKKQASEKKEKPIRIVVKKTIVKKHRKASQKKSKKPARKAVSTIVATKKSVEKKTLAASKTIAVAPKPAAPAPVVPPVVEEERPKGKIMSIPKPTEKSMELLAEERAAILAEDGFMQKVLRSAPPVLTKPIKLGDLWSHFFKRAADTSSIRSAVVPTPTTPKEDIDIKKDAFFRRVEQKRADAVVGTAVDDPNAPPPPDLGVAPKKPSALEDFASTPAMSAPDTTAQKSKGTIITAAQLKQEAEDAKRAAARLAEDAKKDAPQQAKATETKQPPAKEEEKAAAPHVKVVIKQSNGLQKFLAGLEHFGMGKERMQFTENLATMLDAGLPLVEALQTLLAETKNKGFKKILQRIVDRVENGTPLWRSMDAENFFSLHAIALTRIGEEAGNLAKNMQYLAEQETKDHELVQKVKMAMIYPSIVMTIMFIIVMGLGLFVLPNLIGVLTSLNVKLPLVTRIVIGFSNAFSKHGVIIVPGSIGGIVFLIILAKYTPLKVVFQWLTFRIPGIGSLLRSATIARFGVILGGLMQAGVPVVDAVQSLVEVTPILVYKHFYEKLRDHITIGDSFGRSFTSIKGSEKLLPTSVQQLVVTGEKSGALATIMLKVADIYDKKASETAQKLPVILEPILLLIIGSLVGTIAFAIIVPIYSIVGSVGRQ